MRWSRWRSKGVGKGSAESGDAISAPDVVDVITSGLLERGVTPEDARALGTRLAASADVHQGPALDAYLDAYLDGVSTSWHALGEARGKLDTRLREINEVERLMGAFSGELGKLDEVLEVLAAYVRRMKVSKGVSSEERMLH